MPEPCEVAMVRLEGAYEQIDRRLDALEARLGSIENRITLLHETRIDPLIQRSFSHLCSD